MYKVSPLLMDWVWFDWNFECQPNYVWADGNMVKAGGQRSKMVEHPNQIQLRPTSRWEALYRQMNKNILF